MIKTPKVSVIVPVYKVEPYIEKCARSLFEQTLDDIEFVFINDCTPDRSIDILKQVLEDYPHRKERVKIVNHEVNKGTATTRNTGLTHTTGQYIIHCDSDDWIDLDMYEKMYEKAVAGNYDIVLSDYSQEFHKKSIYKKQNFEGSSSDFLKALLKWEGVTPYLPIKLVKADIYKRNHLSFPDGINIREDYVVMVQLSFYSENIGYCPGAFYHYRQHTNSITKTSLDGNPELIDVRIKAMYIIRDFLTANGVFEEFEKEYHISLLVLKLFILNNTSNKKRWIKLFSESNKHIKDFSGRLPNKLALWFASKNSIHGYNFFSTIQKVGSALKSRFHF